MKEFLVIGCPHSGTMFTAALLETYGYVVAHENAIQDDGISAWNFAVTDVDQEWTKLPRRRHERYKKTIHIVRSPLSWLPAMTVFMDGKFRHVVPRYCVVYDSSSDTEVAAQLWVLWNTICAAQSDVTIRLEDAPDLMRAYLGREPDSPAPAKLNSKQSKRPHKPFESWENLKAVLTEAAFKSVVLSARRYGYAV